MKRSLSLGLLFLVGLMAPASHATPVWRIVNDVSQDDYTTYLRDRLYTRTGNNRRYDGASGQHSLAREFIYNEFASFGLDVYLHPFLYGSNTYYNVVATHRGVVRPNDIYIIGAHFDSVNCPGADDNASGVAAVLEAASVMSNYYFASTVIFIAFDREEQGLVGSWAYANEHASDNILGMVSLDMIAYNPNNAYRDRVSLYGGSTNPEDRIKLDLAEAINQYGNGLTPVRRGRITGSDHHPFSVKGFSSALVIEDAMSAYANPHYHKVTDSVDTPNYIDYEYAWKITRSMVGYLATQAGETPEPSTLYLLALGLAALAIVCRTRRRRHPSA